jgi:hydroxymethylbilane synthase
LDQCQQAFPALRFEIKIIKTTGDKKLTASMAQPDPSLPKGLFTKELEVALLKHRADLAVHSLKDLPTDLPSGLVLGAVGARADVRDVLVYRDAAFLEARSRQSDVAERTSGPNKQRGFGTGLGIRELPQGAVVATSSTRRKAQLLDLNPSLQVVEIRGNVVTRLQKVAEQPKLDATLLAFAGLQRLNFSITTEGFLRGDAVPDGLRATLIPPEDILPCVGQAAIGIETRQNDERIETICQRLNHYNTFQCVTAERAFLHTMGGGCQSPVGAHSEVLADKLRIRAVSFRDGAPKRAEAQGNVRDPVLLGEEIASHLR